MVDSQSKIGFFNRFSAITFTRKLPDTNYLEKLESESILILREVAAQFSRPALLFSGGKDSTVLIHPAIKAFYPAPRPFKLMHIDTGHNFPEALALPDMLAMHTGVDLIVRKVEDTIKTKDLKEPEGKFPSRCAIV